MATAAVGSLPVATDTTEPMVLVSEKRLRELEALEASLPTLVSKAVKDMEATKIRLKALRENHPTPPAEKNRRVLEHYHKNKDEINARRRAARKAKREAAGGSSGSPGKTV